MCAGSCATDEDGGAAYHTSLCRYARSNCPASWQSSSWGQSPGRARLLLATATADAGDGSGIATTPGWVPPPPT